MSVMFPSSLAGYQFFKESETIDTNGLLLGYFTWQNSLLHTATNYWENLSPLEWYQPWQKKIIKKNMQKHILRMKFRNRK